jgi:hypothetical protein
MVHGTAYICTDGVCDPLTRENARLAFAYIMDNCTIGEKERERLTGRSRARVRDTRERASCTHARAPVRKRKRRARYLCARTMCRRGGRAECFSDTYTRIRYVDDAVINSATGLEGVGTPTSEFTASER